MGRAADHAGFRSVMATFATGVTVVTAAGADGPAGNSGGEPLLFSGQGGPVSGRGAVAPYR